MSITPSRVELEDPTHLNRPQRLTWVYDIGFTGTADFTAAQVTLTLNASIHGESATAYLYLIQQPNPYENDGPTSWLSTDLRVLQITEGQSRFGVAVGTDPTGFIGQVLTNLNAGTTGSDQCLVSEIAFTPAPAQNGATPSVSDKLAQRNLAIVASANPGLAASRRIPQTFEIRPSQGKPVHDELMLEWGNVPAGSEATLYLPGMDVDEIIRLSARQYHSYRLRRIDADTLRLDTGGITYLPIPFSDSNLPGMLTIDLPEGVKKGQVLRVLVRQVTGGYGAIGAAYRLAMPAEFGEMRHILGSFQLTIPVREKAEMLPGQERLLSNLRWIERAIPARDRWAGVFGRYVMQVADRVDALGGDASKVAPSPTGEWRAAYPVCLGLGVVAALLLALLLLTFGVLAGGPVAAAALVLALLAGAVAYWRKHCRPTYCQQLIALLAGAVLGTLALALAAVLGIAGPALVPALTAGAALALAAALRAWSIGCFD